MARVIIPCRGEHDERGVDMRETCDRLEEALAVHGHTLHALMGHSAYVRAKEESDAGLVAMIDSSLTDIAYDSDEDVLHPLGDWHVAGAMLARALESNSSIRVLGADLAGIVTLTD